MNDAVRNVVRNVVVARLGTPDKTTGSVNNPIVFEEDGLRFNEKWVYLHLVDDPSGMPERVIYWHRYDLIATRVRENHGAQWRDDSTLVNELGNVSPRLSPQDPANNPPLTPRDPYRAVSEFKGKPGLGLYVQSEEELRKIEPAPALPFRKS